VTSPAPAPVVRKLAASTPTVAKQAVSAPAVALAGQGVMTSTHTARDELPPPPEGGASWPPATGSRH
jgi:hypothetical protein